MFVNLSYRAGCRCRLLQGIVLWVLWGPSLFGADKTNADYAFSSTWLKALHYGSVIRGGWLSTVDQPEFFLSPDGPSDPVAEFRAAGRLMADPRQRHQLACRFPYRFRLLGGDPEFVRRHCPAYRRWRRQLAPGRSRPVRVVFASWYTGNPSSFFGHLFLRVPTARPLPDLDAALGFYARVAPDESGPSYVWRGFTGGFRGHWLQEPFYEKYREYVLVENRDLWSYELQLDPDQQEKLLEHFWEMSRYGYADYYFMGENCAHGLMALLQAVLPERRLGGAPPVMALPWESLQVLMKAGVLGPGQRIPSRRRSLGRALDSAPVAGLQRIRRSLRRQQPGEVQDPTELDLLIGWLTYRQAVNRGHLATGDDRLLQAALVRRAAAGASPPPPEPPPAPTDRAPDQVLPASSLGAGIVRAGQRSFAVLDWRAGFYDLLNPPADSLTGSEFVAGGLRLRFEAEKPAVLQRLTLIRLRQLNPVHPLEWPLSFEFDLGYVRRPEDCSWCDERRLRFLAGLSMALNQHLLRGLGGLQLSFDDPEGLNAHAVLATGLTGPLPGGCYTVELERIFGHRSSGRLQTQVGYALWLPGQWELRMGWIHLEEAGARTRLVLHRYF